MFFRNVGWFSTDYTALCSRKLFITNAVRGSNPILWDQFFIALVFFSTSFHFTFLFLHLNCLYFLPHFHHSAFLFFVYQNAFSILHVHFIEKTDSVAGELHVFSRNAVLVGAARGRPRRADGNSEHCQCGDCVVQTWGCSRQQNITWVNTQPVQFSRFVVFF
jgi:hypothetical protein